MLTWDAPNDRAYQTGVDRGVFYPRSLVVESNTPVTIGIGPKTFVFNQTMYRTFPVGATVKITKPSFEMVGIVTASDSNSVTINVTSTVGGGSYTGWTLTQQDTAIAWNGITGVDEGGSDSAVAYYVDGRPFLYFPKPKEYTATLKAYTYPPEFSEILGMAEATAGMFLDSQVGDTFAFSYRTLVGGVQGIGNHYKIHIVYNATVTPGGISYDTIGSSINPVDFSFAIQAVPLPIQGYRPTAHIVIDSLNMDPDKLAEIEALLYGTDVLGPSLPSPQEIFDILSFGDTIIITDFGDGTWQAEGASKNVYMTEEGLFRIDNVNAVDNGDGTYDVSSTP